MICPPEIVSSAFSAVLVFSPNMIAQPGVLSIVPPATSSFASPYTTIDESFVVKILPLCSVELSMILMSAVLYT